MNSALCRTLLRLHAGITKRQILSKLDELNRTQWLSRDELLALQRTKVQRLVDYAYQYIPYYQRIFDAKGFEPGDLGQDLKGFDQLPILTKTIIRENFNELLTTEPVRKQQMSKLSTSGSTGQPLIFMQDPDFRDAVTADIQRHMGWAGWKLGDLQALIWGASYKPTLSKKIRAQLIDWVWNRFQINAFMMTNTSMSAFVKRILRQKPRILFGYATSLHRFAQFVRESQYPKITFDGIFASAEMLLPEVRQFIEETFKCKVYNRYGTLELGGVACECQSHTGLHVSVENNYVEILSNSHAAPPEVVGDLIVTNLNNRGMPFIRYSIGDAATWYPQIKCLCGRASPMISAIEGRLVDSFKTYDGRIVWSGFAGATFRCLAQPAIKQFQVVQKSLDKMLVRLVLNSELPENALKEITQVIQATYGDCITVDFEYLDQIPLLPSGKHLYAISELNRS